MFEWLKRRASRSRPRRSDQELLATIDAALDEADWGPPSIGRVCQALDELVLPGAAASEELLALVRPRVTRWYERHPLAVKWSRSYDFAVSDPLQITTEETIRSAEEAELAPWATLLRTFEVVIGGANVFHHGCDAASLLALLRDPAAPARIQNLPLPSLVDETPAEVDALVELLCTSNRFGDLQHLSFGTGLTLEPRHFERLARAPWAASLLTLDLTEKMVDWSVDREADLQRVLRALGGFESLTHLVLYNDIGTTHDAAALLESTFPALTHLNLGSGPTDAGFLELLATTESLPKLEELCLSGGPHGASGEWARAVDARFSIFLHGQRVTAEYPKRTP